MLIRAEREGLRGGSSGSRGRCANCVGVLVDRVKVIIVIRRGTGNLNGERRCGVSARLCYCGRASRFRQRGEGGGGHDSCISRRDSIGDVVSNGGHGCSLGYEVG